MHCATTSFYLKICCNKSRNEAETTVAQGEGTGYAMGLNGNGLVSEHVDKVRR